MSYLSDRPNLNFDQTINLMKRMETLLRSDIDSIFKSVNNFLSRINYETNN